MSVTATFRLAVDGIEPDTDPICVGRLHETPRPGDEVLLLIGSEWKNFFAKRVLLCSDGELLVYVISRQCVRPPNLSLIKGESHE